jgi:hypothetical protein
MAAFLFFWDEAGFASSMKVDSHKKYWCNENPHADCGNPLHVCKRGLLVTSGGQFSVLVADNEIFGSRQAVKTVR